MGFNKRKREDERRRVAEKEAASRRATDAQLFEDTERLIAAWNERQGKRMPMIFSPTIGAAIAAGNLLINWAVAREHRQECGAMKNPFTRHSGCTRQDEAKAGRCRG